MTRPGDPTEDCCAAAGVAPGPVSNRAGQPSLAYRVTTHAASVRRLLTRLSAATVVDPATGALLRPLAGLTARSPDDFSVALLDAWSVVADVLTFYQERVANEGFLRTATERRSVLELARAIGYELRPGVAASAFLAFTIEDAVGAPGSAVVPAGTRVQSVPSQGQLPQTFETGAALTARAEYNALRPRVSRPQELAVYEPAGGPKQLVLLGLSTDFGPGTPGLLTIPAADHARVYPLDPAAVLPAGQDVAAVPAQSVYLAGTNTGLRPDQPLLFVGKKGATAAPLVLMVRRVVAEPEQARTRVDVAPRPSLPVFKPLWKQPAVVQLARLDLVQEQVDVTIRERRWRERDLSAFLAIQGWSGRSVARHVNVFQPLRPAGPPPVPQAPDDVAPGLFTFQARAGFFGHNAPAHAALPDPKPAGLTKPWDPWPVWKDYPDEAYYSASSGPADVYLERAFPEVEGKSWALFEKGGDPVTPFWVRGVSERSVTGFSLSGKATGLDLGKAEDGAGLADADKPDAYTVRATTAHVQSRRLGLAELPVEDPVAGDTLEMDRLVLGLQVGQAVLLGGERADLRGVVSHQALVLSDVVHSGGLTTLVFAETPLTHPYVRGTVTVNANVAEATHGETVTEVLGGGDGAKPHQRFTLAKPPLTYVLAPGAGGARSTLGLRVDGVLWQEAAALYGLDGRSERYVVRRQEDGRTRVQFGDGEMGARLPMGTENVTAVYRSGIGQAGLVAAGSLTLLQTRPLGVRGVTNPLPATGAADPESRDDARGNAPLTVLTLDRIVSRRDYEDFARAFAGVGKALAVPLKDTAGDLVHLTVAVAAPPAADPSEPAPPATREVDPASPVYRNLVAAIGRAHDPAQRFRVDSYDPRFFNVRGRVLVDAPRYEPAAVLAAVEAALKDAFAFERRGFGQRVTAAEVLAVMQNVPGVAAADLHQLYPYEDNQTPPDPDAEIVPELLEARPARYEAGRLVRAELLLINPVGVALEEMKA